MCMYDTLQCVSVIIFYVQTNYNAMCIRIIKYVYTKPDGYTISKDANRLPIDRVGEAKSGDLFITKDHAEKEKKMNKPQSRQGSSRMGARREKDADRRMA